MGYNGNGTYCKDVDECSSSEPCNQNASCINTEGSFTCQCNDGFIGDGVGEAGCQGMTKYDH